MIGRIIVLVIFAAIQALIGVAYLKGKCDGFIAGYNTASREDQARYDIKKLRLLVACLHFVIAGLFFLFLFRGKWTATVFLWGVIVSAVLVLILARTWAKKKNE